MSLRVATLFATLFVIASLTACGSNDVHFYGRIDPTEKTMAVPTGGDWLLANLKGALVNDGWTLTVDIGQNVTGQVAPETSLAIRPSSPARYRLRGRASQVDYCIVGRPQMRYDFSVVDTKTFTEVVTVAGLDSCVGEDPVARILAAIKAAGG